MSLLPRTKQEAEAGILAEVETKAVIEEVQVRHNRKDRGDGGDRWQGSEAECHENWSSISDRPQSDPEGHGSKFSSKGRAQTRGARWNQVLPKVAGLT